jgi:hypothetical protein
MLIKSHWKKKQKLVLCLLSLTCPPILIFNPTQISHLPLFRPPYENKLMTGSSGFLSVADPGFFPDTGSNFIPDPISGS